MPITKSCLNWLSHILIDHVVYCDDFLCIFWVETLTFTYADYLFLRHYFNLSLQYFWGFPQSIVLSTFSRPACCASHGLSSCLPLFAALAIVLNVDSMVDRSLPWPTILSISYKSAFLSSLPIKFIGFHFFGFPSLPFSRIIQHSPQKWSKKHLEVSSEDSTYHSRKFKASGSKYINDNVYEKIKVVHGRSLQPYQEVLGFFSLLLLQMGALFLHLERCVLGNSPHILLQPSLPRYSWRYWAHP